MATTVLGTAWGPRRVSSPASGVLSESVMPSLPDPLNLDSKPFRGRWGGCGGETGSRLQVRPPACDGPRSHVPQVPGT